MAWPYLASSDLTKIRNCVDSAVENAKHHRDEMGETDAEKAASTIKLSDKMKPSDNDGVEYLWIKYDRYRDRGQVGLMFQKMKWMSKYAWPRLGDVWVVSTVFENEVLPHDGDDQEYISFLNHLTDRRGPLHDFMDDRGVTSLFSVGRWQPNTPKKTKRIGQLELVARTVWDGNDGDWSIEEAIQIHPGYMGQDDDGNDVRIPKGVVRHWAKHFPGQVFGLTEMKFVG